MNPSRPDNVVLVALRVVSGGADRKRGTWRRWVRADTGCGMTREELVDSLGTIARSGTANFMQQLKVTAPPRPRIEENTT